MAASVEATHISTTPAHANHAPARWMARQKDGLTVRDAVIAELRASGKAAPGQRDLRGIRLIGEDLSGVDLSGCDLSGADLSQANLTGARLVKTMLSGAVLNDTNLTGAELLGAELTGADLTGSRVPRAGFGQANLTGAVLFNVEGAGATFSGARLNNADLRAADLTDARLCAADLRGAELERANLRGADLEAALLAGADFDGAILRDARFGSVSGYTEASWIGTNIQSADFCGAYLVRRHIMDQNYLHEFRNQSRAAGVMYTLWWVTSDCGRSVVRWALWTALIVVIYALLYSASALDYGDYPTPMSAVYYSVVTLTSLGYGDVLPQSLTAQALAMSEVVLGYVMLGGLISILANKMARRAD